MSKTSLGTSLKAARDHERRARREQKRRKQAERRIERQSDSIPKLITWAQQLTADGSALADWLIAEGLTEDRPSAKRLFAEHEDEVSALWAQYTGATAEKSVAENMV